MTTTIKLKNGTGVPTSGALVQGEPAFDLTNKRLYTENAGGTVIEVGTNPSTLSVTGAATFGGQVSVSVDASFTGLKVSATGGGDALSVAPLAAGSGVVVGALNSTLADYEPMKLIGETIEFDTRTGVGTSATRMTLDASGNLTTTGAIESTKFNTAADRAVLDAPSGDGRFRVSTNSTTYGFFRANTSVIQIGTDSVEPLDFHTNNVFRMRLDGSGNLLAGHTAQVLSSKVLSQFSGATHNGIIINETADTASTAFLGFCLSETPIGSVVRVGATSAVAYNTTSDERLKSNIANSDPVLEKIMQVQVRQYDWTEGNLHQDYGFIAQELAPVLSGIVTEGKEEADMWQLDYSRLTPALLKAIQEQQAIIESLTARIEALEGAK